MATKKPAIKNYPLWVRDPRVRSRVNQKVAELSVKFGRTFTQQDAIVYLLDQDQIRQKPATAPANGAEVAK